MYFKVILSIFFCHCLLFFLTQVVLFTWCKIILQRITVPCLTSSKINNSHIFVSHFTPCDTLISVFTSSCFSLFLIPQALLWIRILFSLCLKFVTLKSLCQTRINFRYHALWLLQFYKLCFDCKKKKLISYANTPGNQFGFENIF